MVFNLVLSIVIVLVYLLTHLGNRSNSTKDKTFLIIISVILFLLIAFRGSTIGNDTSSYIEFYNYCDSYKWDALRNNYYEGGYIIFNVLLSYLHISPRVFLMIVALVCCVSLYFFVRDNSKNYLMSILMYTNLMFFYQSMNIMRQFLALSIVLFAFRLIKDKKLFKYILAVLFASLFHSTALVAVLIYPIYHMKYNRKRVLIVVLCSILVMALLAYIYPLITSFLGRESYYLDVLGEAKISNIISTAMFLVMYLFALFITEKNNISKHSFYLYSLLFAAAFNFISIDMSVLNRAALYFSVLSIVSLPNIIELNVKQNKLFVESAVIILLILYSSVVMICRPEWNSAYNYSPCTLQEDSFICE